MARKLEVRELYCPSHFGNTYEVALNSEMREILSEAKFWGFNQFSDWFDTIDLYDVYKRSERWYNMPEAMWARKFQNFEMAHELGYRLALCITPNHVFSDQVTSANEAVKNDRYFGQLVCPSRPGVMELILENHRNLFKDFARRGLALRSISACPYDYGGCGCEVCSPWIETFGKLYREIILLAREYFGEVEADLTGWWWSDEDHQTFSAWADREAKGFFTSLAFHLPYGTTEYKLRPIPQGCSERAFVHIGYGENDACDQYGHYGPSIAPRRIEKTVNFLFSRNAKGFIAYSEGDSDEINKAVLGGLTSGTFSNADEVLKAYADRYLGGDAAGWAAWLGEMGEFYAIDASHARKGFDRLKKSARPSWRLGQLEDRLILAEMNAAVALRKTWDKERLESAKKFIDVKEHLFRQVWRLGLLRHIFQFDFRVPEWYQEYQELVHRVKTDETITLAKHKEA
jgi:hypothetical protein